MVPSEKRMSAEVADAHEWSDFIVFFYCHLVFNSFHLSNSFIVAFLISTVSEAVEKNVSSIWKNSHKVTLFTIGQA